MSDTPRWCRIATVAAGAALTFGAMTATAGATQACPMSVPADQGIHGCGPIHRDPPAPAQPGSPEQLAQILPTVSVPANGTRAQPGPGAPAR
ncbi:hypothetical protein [Amycolatopsis orientalis]|uniref:hypothetical protein n=1 Tax=Amycolatopsis orientalis TaxID=31958 RepID=UPI00039E7556|nr:hypothetical protein [Amycolatopsis orientalis]